MRLIPWSSFNAISQSKPVKSVAIWFLLVPIIAKLLTAISPGSEYVIFSYKLDLNIVLPFQWKHLFYAACCFLLARIIYVVFCPNFIQSYNNYADFLADKKGFLQLNGEIYLHVTPTLGKTVRDDDFKEIKSYLNYYSSHTPDYIEKTLTNDMSSISNALSHENANEKSKGGLNDAFYFYYSFADKCLWFIRFIVLAAYTWGFYWLIRIAYTNFMYVFDMV